jgi:SAM-dependent methyltransferase
VTPPTAFDPYATRYQDEVQKSIAFAGVRHDVFLTAKVDALEALARGDGRDPRALEVLDLGCGVGVMTRMLAARFGRVTGTDPSGQALRTAGGARRRAGLRTLRRRAPAVPRRRIRLRRGVVRAAPRAPARACRARA